MARTTFFLAAVLAGTALGCSQPASPPSPSNRAADAPVKPTDRDTNVDVQGPRGGRVKVDADGNGSGTKVDVTRPSPR